MAKKLVYMCIAILTLPGALHIGTRFGRASMGGQSGTTWIVTSSADAGPGTLRQQLLSAGHGDTVVFDPPVFPPSSPVPILLASELPSLTQGVLTIDASNGGVILDGSGASAGAVGLRVDSDSDTVKGLQVMDFPGGGILVAVTADHNTIEGNVISTNAGQAGLMIAGSKNAVHGNLIGTDASGTVAMGNDNHQSAHAPTPRSRVLLLPTVRSRSSLTRTTRA